MKFILFAAAIFSFVVYGYAIKKLFSHEHGIDPRMRLLKACASIFAIGHLSCLWQLPDLIEAARILAFGIYLTGLGVFFAAKNALRGYRLTLAFSPDTPDRLIDEGIYARVRHPFYLAYSLTWLAGVVAAPSFWTVATTLVMIVFYVVAARVEERKFLAADLRFVYALYRRRAGLLWPRI